MSADFYFLDVNIPMYAAGRDHPYREACVWVMTEIAEGRLSAIIDCEIIQEILHRYGFLHEWEIAVSMATNLFTLVDSVFPVLPENASLAIELFEQYGRQGIATRDLIHAAVMQGNDLTQIISTDEHFDQIEGLTRIDPQILFGRSHVRRE